MEIRGGRLGLVGKKRKKSASYHHLMQCPAALQEEGTGQGQIAILNLFFHAGATNPNADPGVGSSNQLQTGESKTYVGA